jgi:hypothetical protein
MILIVADILNVKVVNVAWEKINWGYQSGEMKKEANQEYSQL